MKGQGLRGLRWYLGFLLLGVGLPVAHAQSYPHCWQLRQALSSHWQQDSLKASPLTYAYLTCLLADSSMSLATLPRPQADTLMRLFEIGVHHDATNRSTWKLERASLALQRRREYEPKLRTWLMEAIEAEPLAVPIFFYDEAAQLTMADYSAMRLSLNDAVGNWALLDRGLLRGELEGAEQAARYATTRTKLRLLARTNLPDCAQLLANFGEPVAMKSLGGPAAETFLLLHELQGCDLPPVYWDNALTLAKAPQGPHHNWLLRLEGQMHYNHGAFALAAVAVGSAAAMEPVEALKASDLLMVARCQSALGDYKSARTAIQEARRIRPRWGEPLLSLMDLYLDGIHACTMSDFDQKAVYWILMDLCRQLLNSADQEAHIRQANERIFQYRQLCPTAAEAKFRGLEPGDKHPIRCWMSTVAVVQY